MTRPLAQDPDRRVVYDSTVGIICPVCNRPPSSCICPNAKSTRARRPTVPRDGVVRILRERRNRQGKTVTIVMGVPGSTGEVEELASSLRRLCGAGGTCKGSIIEIQGDHRDLIKARLETLGYRVKLAGG